MKWCPDNQINASFIIGLHPVEQTAFRSYIKDNGYKSVFTNLWLERQQNRSGIRDWAKIPKRVNSFIDGSAFCPGAPKRVPSDSEKQLRVYTSSHICHSHEWRVDTATGKTLKKQNVKTSADRRLKIKLRV